MALMENNQWDAVESSTFCLVFPCNKYVKFYCKSEKIAVTRAVVIAGEKHTSAWIAKEFRVSVNDYLYVNKVKTRFSSRSA